MTIALNVNGKVSNRVYSFTIEGNLYYFHVYYNQRWERWQVVLYNKDNNPLSTPDPTPLKDLGKMMPNSALTWRYKIFDGEIVCVDTLSDGKTSVGKDNFGAGLQYQLVYFTEQETEEFRLEDWTTYKRV